MGSDKEQKKFGPAQVTNLAGLVQYQTGAIVSRELMKKPAGRLSVFAFDAEEALSEHTSPFDAFVQVLEGEAEIMISGKPHQVRAGEIILMPANEPHALRALKPFKMVLTMLR